MRRRRQARLALGGSKAHGKGVAATAIGAGGVAADEGLAAGTAAVIQAEDAAADGKSSCWLLGGSFW
jgi:hypothetical protein